MQIGQANFWRLGKVLRSKHALEKEKSASGGRAFTRPRHMGSRHAGSLTGGARKLSQETMKQVRHVVGDHVYVTSRNYASGSA